MLKIHNSLTGEKEEFKPLFPNEVRMYVCGMTNYDYIHVGHARMLVAFDLVQRYLRSLGYKVTYVRNVTDIDDKIIERAAANGENWADLAQRFTVAMHEDCKTLGLQEPDLEPRATQYIGPIIDMIQTLMDKGYAYAAGNGDVMYSVRKFPNYGRLSGKKIDDLRAGSRVRIDEAKLDPLDFVLWKHAKPGEPSWASPWGAGRPGWHIECSAMSTSLLGSYFDLHGGGEDLKFPHHENEIAQSCAACDSPFVHVWMHNGFVRVNEEKMSKSLGNFFTVRDVLKTLRDPEVLRFFLLSSHYRGPINYSAAQLVQADETLLGLYRALKDAPTSGSVDAAEVARFRDAMDDDFNTAAAVGHLYDSFVLANKLLDEPKSAPKDVWRRTLARLRRDLAACGETLGIFRRPPREFLLARRARRCARLGIDPAWVEAQIAARAAARAAKDFARADEIRKALKEARVELMDTPTGTTWRVA